MIKPGDEPFPSRDDDGMIPFDSIEFEGPIEPAPMIEPLSPAGSGHTKATNEVDPPIESIEVQLTHSGQEITDTIWFLLAARCAKCQTTLDTDDIKGLRDQDPLRWARMAGMRATDAGWMAATSKALLFCPDCVSSRPT